MAVVTMRQLLESGVHFGHQTRRWNPKMKRFIMTERNGIYIIDLQQSLAYIDRSYAFVKETVANGGVVMFVGTKKQAQEAIAEQATRVGMPYVNQRWLGGMLTNFQTVHQRINRLKELDEIDFDDVAGSNRTKKELLGMKRERTKLDKTLGGIRDMTKVPSAVWIVDTNKEHLAVEEARKLRIPIIGILDSNCDPDLVDFPIPGNDDAIRAVGLLTRVVADAVAEGLIARSGAKGGADATTAEPLAEWERELLEGDAEKVAVQATGGDAATDAPAGESTGAAAEAPAADAAVEAVTEAPAADVSAADATTEAPAAGGDASADEVNADLDAAALDAASVDTATAVKDAEAPTEAGEAQIAGSAPANEDGSAPEGFDIKGNKSSMKFHGPTSPWYDRTKAEIWFDSAEAAEAAGFVNAEAKA
jgi:ribosomal protein S2